MGLPPKKCYFGHGTCMCQWQELVLATSHSFTFQNRRQMERGSHMKRTKMGNQCGAPLMAEEKAIVILSLKQNLFLKYLKVFILKYIYIYNFHPKHQHKGVPKNHNSQTNLVKFYFLSVFKRNCLFLLSIICF